MHLFKDCEYAEKTDLQVCGVKQGENGIPLGYSSTRNSEFAENNSFKLLCSQLCELNLEKMDFQKEERHLHQSVRGK